MTKKIQKSMKLSILRDEMRAEHIDAIIIPSGDPHNSEYPATHWQGRKWITGFTGSAGTAVVTLDDAALWTDSRYFLQAETQLQGSGVRLMKDGLPDTPTITQWLLQKMSVTNGRCVAVDGMVVTYGTVVALQRELQKIGVTVRTNYDAFKMIWRERPVHPATQIYSIPEQLIGETVESKLLRIRQVMKQNLCSAHVLTDLMSIAWTFNLRASDVAMTPVFEANLYIGSQNAIVFVNGKMTPEAQRMMTQAGVVVKHYDEFADFLRSTDDVRVMCDSNTTCYTVYNILRQRVVDLESPVTAFKAVKNEKEIEGFRQSMLRDGVAMVRFLRWLKPAVVAGGETEISVADKLEAFRREDVACQDLSFSTICGYNAHGAIVHYSATPETDVVLKPEGLLLVDSGAQYIDGTTDITRTIALGPVTDEMRRVYTYVLKANIALATKIFPDGINGSQIDAIAHSEVWQGGYNYLHGTGHGVGWRLCVHEGPHAIRLDWRPAPLHAGMTVTDEPGVYLAGKFGVRTENMMLVVDVPGVSGDNETRFIKLEPLTLCPIDTTPIDFSLLTDAEIAWLNGYHDRVRQSLLPLLAVSEDREWLIEATAAVQKL